MDKQDAIVSRVIAICDYNCAGCAFYPVKKEHEKDVLNECSLLAMFNCEENGGSMGFEPWKEKLELPKKSIKEMTLGELKSYCQAVQAENDKCSICNIKGDYGVCPFEGVKPPMWNFDGPPKFTEEERNAAKVIRDMFPAVISVYREKRTNELTLLDKFNNCRVINGEMFPTIKTGMSALIEEIIGDGAWGDEE